MSMVQLTSDHPTPVVDWLLVEPIGGLSFNIDIFISPIESLSPQKDMFGISLCCSATTLEFTQGSGRVMINNKQK